MANKPTISELADIIPEDPRDPGGELADRPGAFPTYLPPEGQAGLPQGLRGSWQVNGNTLSLSSADGEYDWVITLTPQQMAELAADYSR
jgi:hypothetical protein